MGYLDHHQLLWKLPWCLLKMAGLQSVTAPLSDPCQFERLIFPLWIPQKASGPTNPCMTLHHRHSKNVEPNTSFPCKNCSNTGLASSLMRFLLYSPKTCSPLRWTLSCHRNFFDLDILSGNRLMELQWIPALQSCLPHCIMRCMRGPPSSQLQPWTHLLSQIHQRHLWHLVWINCRLAQFPKDTGQIWTSFLITFRQLRSWTLWLD